MKKNLFKVLFGVCLFMVGLNVNAEVSNSYENMEDGVGSDTQNVLVGDVATPVYNVNFYWNDLTFDWVYDEDTQEFGWAPANLCESVLEGSYVKANYAEELAAGKIYSDNTCSTGVSEENLVDEDEYFMLYERETVSINIEDYSENGQIVPTIEWNHVDDYSYVDAKFTYTDEACVLVPSENVYDVAVNYGIYSDSACSTEATANGFAANTYYTIVEKNSSVTNEGELPDTARVGGAGSVDEVDGYTFVNHVGVRNYYFLRLTLENNTTPTKAPTAGTTIGTITISVKAK